MPAAVNSEEDEEEDIGSEEEDDFVPSPYSRASLVPVEADHCKVKRRAFSMPKIPSPSSSSFNSKLITIGELGGTPWECSDEGKTSVKRDWQVDRFDADVQHNDVHVQIFCVVPHEPNCQFFVWGNGCRNGSWPGSQAWVARSSLSSGR